MLVHSLSNVAEVVSRLGINTKFVSIVNRDDVFGGLAIQNMSDCFLVCSILVVDDSGDTLGYILSYSL